MQGDTGHHSRAEREMLGEFSQEMANDPSTRVENFLAQTDTRPDGDVRQLVSAEMSFRLNLGEAIREEEYRARFPDLGDLPALIEEATAVHDRAEQIRVRIERETAAPSVGKLGDYELLEVLGRGGMGIVYRARQQRLNRIVAVKTIIAGQLARADQVERFRREAEAAARLDHPGIVPVFEIGEEKGVVFFSMGYVPGSGLAQQLQHNTFTAKAAAELVRQLADAVQYAHDANVVHRDLKPANVLLDEQGQPKITDFGLAKLVDRDDGMTITGAVVGTPSYMSPEQAMGAADRVGPSSDIYGLGAILYACICGHPPFRGSSTVATLRLVTNERATPLRQLRPDLPRDLETICHKCLEKDPASRYAAAGDLAAELGRFLEGRPVLARPVPAWTRLYQWCRRNPVIASLLSAVVVTLVTGIAFSSYFAVLAEGRATKAEEGFRTAQQQSQVALEVVQSVIHTVQEKLKTIPEAREVRRELLIGVLDDLKRVSRGYLDGASIDVESARALNDLAKLYSEVGDEAGTGVDELADTHYRRSVDIYLQLIELNPDDDELISTALGTITDYGDTAREYRRFESAIWAHRHGRRIAVGLYERRPDSPSAQLAYLKSAESLGEALLRSGAIAESADYILEAGDLVREYVEAHPTVVGYENVARCLCTVGDLHRIRKEYSKAAAAYEEMSQATLKLIELEPDNPSHLNGRSADFERLGDLYLDQKDYPRARECYEQMLVLSEKYIADDPTNLFRLQESTWAYKRIRKICTLMNEPDRAKWAAERLAEIEAKLGRKSDPKEAVP